MLERGRRGDVSNRGLNWLIVRTGDLTSAFILRRQQILAWNLRHYEEAINVPSRPKWCVSGFLLLHSPTGRQLNTGVSGVSRALRDFVYYVLPDPRSPAASGHTLELLPLCPYISLEAINLSKFTRIVCSVERFPLIRKRDEWAIRFLDRRGYIPFFDTMVLAWASSGRSDLFPSLQFLSNWA